MATEQAPFILLEECARATQTALVAPSIERERLNEPTLLDLLLHFQKPLKTQPFFLNITKNFISHL